VQFFWDRLGKLDEHSSCWVRVSNAWAGKNWGFIQIPRIGQEVIVEFLEGDPDRPIITGRVYNAEMMPPYALPDNGTQSGLKTRSAKGGDPSTFNELRFEDKKGSEEVYLHSQKDFDALTENDETWQVMHDRTTTIKHDETKTVKEGNETTTVEKGTQTITVEGDRAITVKTGKQELTVKTGDMTTEVSTGNQTNTIKTGNMTTEVSLGNHATTVKAGNVSLKANAGAIANEAMQSIELKCGPSSIKLGPDGITIKGMQVKIEGTVMVEVKGVMTTVKGDGMLTLKGGVTMIN
jgi:type VI secretion system secreted protein VgrG